MSLASSKVIDALAIRNTSPQTSLVAENGDISIKTLVVENGLNQTVSFQCQGCSTADFATPFDIGPSWDVAATTNTYMTCSSYIPYWRIVATCSVAPTTGALTVIVFGVSG